MTDGADLRRAVPEDAPALTSLAARAYAPYVRRLDGLRPGPMDDDYAALIAEAEVWVAETDSETGRAVAGFIVLIDEGTTMLLEGVAVDPTRQGTGIGGRLLRLAEERARAAGCTTIRLYTNVVMVENQRLYESIGYVETHRAHEGSLIRLFYAKELAGGRDQSQ